LDFSTFFILLVYVQFNLGGLRLFQINIYCFYRYRK